MLAVTLDVDWAPDKIVDEVISVLDSYRVPATLFCTNFSKDVSGNSSSLAGRFHERHEIALHPNFQNIGAYDEVWNAILELYPYAKGGEKSQRGNRLADNPVVTSPPPSRTDTT